MALASHADEHYVATWTYCTLNRISNDTSQLKNSTVEQEVLYALE